MPTTIPRNRPTRSSRLTLKDLRPDRGMAVKSALAGLHERSDCAAEMLGDGP
jgi:hypothetical protein